MATVEVFGSCRKYSRACEGLPDPLRDDLERAGRGARAAQLNLVEERSAEVLLGDGRQAEPQFVARLADPLAELVGGTNAPFHASRRPRRQSFPHSRIKSSRRVPLRGLLLPQCVPDPRPIGPDHFGRRKAGRQVIADGGGVGPDDGDPRSRVDARRGNWQRHADRHQGGNRAHDEPPSDPPHHLRQTPFHAGRSYVAPTPTASISFERSRPYSPDAGSICPP